MCPDKWNFLQFAVAGGILGGLLAIIGFWIFSPSPDSIPLFILFRVLIGAGVAAIIGPVFIDKKN